LSNQPTDEPHGDDRNDELDESPMPDRTQGDTDADEDPEAD
jgi:hypothetical protein